MPVVETRKGPVALSPEVCDALLEQIETLKRGGGVVRAFKAAGLGGPIELDQGEKRVVVDAIRRDETEPQLRKLRDYLVDELTEGE